MACTLFLHASFLPVLCSAAPAQNTEMQTPAPVVRIRPRPAAGTPQSAPPDAAPLVHPKPIVLPPHPRAVNPGALSGNPAAAVRTTPTTTTQTPHTAQTAPTSSGAASVAKAVPRKPAASGSAPSAAKAETAGSTAAETAAAAPKPAPRPALSTSGLNRTVIVLDPAHGGVDSGSRLADNEVEKAITLAFAFRLRALLAARGFTVVLTRDSDAVSGPAAPGSPLTLDDRAGIANHSRAAACLLLHATDRGNGVHLYTSELEAAPGEAVVPPWLTAQAAWVPASRELEHSLSNALGRSRIALVSNLASVRPLDSLACPALVLELAPESDDTRSISSAPYQDRIAAAVAGALVFWQNQVQPPPKLAPASTTSSRPRRRTAKEPVAGSTTGSTGSPAGNPVRRVQP